MKEKSSSRKKIGGKKSKFKINLRKEQLRGSKVEEMTAMVIQEGSEE